MKRGRKMKKIFSLLALSFVLTTSAYAEHEKFNYNSQKPITCTTPDRVKDILGNMLGELPYFQGEGTAPAMDGKSFIKTKLIISVNLDTGTFSVVEMLNEYTMCVIAGGEKFQFNSPPTNKTNISLEK